MVSDKKLTDAIGGKSARACDNCIKQRARWYCAADDAFLCQSCDSSVHSANSLARRHERILLKTTSINTLNDKSSKARLQVSVPSWHRGFTRRARTPRKKNHDGKVKFNSTIIYNNRVPENASEGQSNEENEEQLLYRVPVFDPELCSSNDAVLEEVGKDEKGLGYESKATSSDAETKRLPKFLPAEMDAEEFAEDVESLLGSGLEDEPMGLEELGININCTENRVKNDQRTNKPILRLDYEGVLSAWDSRKSPWTTSQRPGLNPGDGRLEISSDTGWMNSYGNMGVMKTAPAAMADRGREDRVSRYREKRRTRLFSKKIRYEVRKLNAEKRPRMKGRFVRRV